MKYPFRLPSSLVLSPRAVRGAAAVALLCAAAAAHAETDREYCERQEGPARTACLRDLDSATKKAAPTAAAAPLPGGALYQVVDGNHVDPNTLKGFQTWRSAACDRCHGANQEGLVGPSLVNSLKVLTKDDFVKTVTNGRLEKGMPSFGADANVVSHLDQLYAYLKGRSDGAITKSKVLPIE